MRYLRLFENSEESTILEIKKIIDENQYVSDKDVTDEKLVYSDKWIIYIAKGTLDHIKSHMVPSVELGDAPGSYYTENWKKGIENVISSSEPEVVTNPPFRTAWTGKDAGIDIGFVTIGYDDKLKNDEMEGFKSYTYERPVRDTRVEETIILKEEEATKTNFLTVVGAKIGEVEGKGLITLWTTYPDFQDGKIDGKEIPMNRNEFKQNGFYFKCSKEFFDKVPSEQMSESKILKYLKTFESFSINENLEIIDRDEQLEEDEKNRIEQTFPYGSIDSENYELFGFTSEEEFEQSVKFGEIDIMRIQTVVTSALEEMFPNSEVICHVYHGDEKLGVSITKNDTDSPAQFDLNIEI